MAPLSLLVAVSVVSAAVSVSAFALSPISPGRATGLVSSSRLFSTIESPPTAPCETSPLQAIVDERREFEINLGRAIDTLRADYPDLLKSAPDFDIYSEKIVAVDPGGAELVGITAYKRFFKFLHMAIGLFYNKEESGVTFKLVYDWARGDIRVSWHASVMPKSLFPIEPLRVDGISVYEFSPTSGKITKHRIDNVNINNIEVRAPQGIFEPASYSGVATGGIWSSVPAPVGVPGPVGDFSLRLLGFTEGSDPRGARSTASLRARSTTSLRAHADDDAVQAFIAKNKARASFGLPALSRDEFDEVNEQVNRLSENNAQRATRNGEAVRERKTGGMMGMLDNFVKDVMKDVNAPETCESSWDCEAPKNCCDFGVAKICCYAGLGVGVQEAEGILEPIPVRSTDGYNYPVPGDNYRPPY